LARKSTRGRRVTESKFIENRRWAGSTERAWISLRRRPEARARRKTVFLVRFAREADSEARKGLEGGSEAPEEGPRQGTDVAERVVQCRRP
jgi:hypothetical protein